MPKTVVEEETVLEPETMLDKETLLEEESVAVVETIGVEGELIVEFCNKLFTGHFLQSARVSLIKPFFYSAVLHINCELLDENT